MLDVRVSEVADPESLVAFVERLAGSGSGGAAVTTATSRIADDLRAGRVPAGLRSLSGSLESPVAARPGGDRPETLFGVVGGEPLVVLSDTGVDELARALAELTGYGMRVLLTGHDTARLDAVRAALPAAVAGRVVDRLPGTATSELCRLRRLLATVGADRATRSGQQLPALAALPSPADVAGCCERAGRTVAGSETGEARVVPAMLRDLDADRRAAVTQVARCVRRSLGALAEAPDADRLRAVVGRLVHGGKRTEFEALQGLAARQRDDRARFAAGPPVEPLEPLAAGDDDTIREYLGFLESGGRSRSYFRSQIQRDAEPALRRFRVDGRTPHTLDHVAATVNHLDLARRDDEIARLCAVLGLDAPGSVPELPALVDVLDRLAATARSVGALRHDVLFLQQDSPVAVPDLPAAERVARAIVDYDDQGDPAEARDELERLAAGLESAVPEGSAAPEHLAAVAALRAHDVTAYTGALDDLGRARREVADRDELTRLLDELGATAPDLAGAWSADAAAGTPGFGLLHPVPADRLLAALPPADAADLVVVLGAGALQADALLLCAAAPRMLAVVGDEPRAASSGTTLVEVLSQASARFLRGTGDRTPVAGAGEPAAAPAAPIPAQQTGTPEAPARQNGTPEAAPGVPVQEAGTGAAVPGVPAQEAGTGAAVPGVPAQQAGTGPAVPGVPAQQAGSRAAAPEVPAQQTGPRPAVPGVPAPRTGPPTSALAPAVRED